MSYGKHGQLWVSLYLQVRIVVPVHWLLVSVPLSAAVFLGNINCHTILQDFSEAVFMVLVFFFLFFWRLTVMF